MTTAFDILLPDRLPPQRRLEEAMTDAPISPIILTNLNTPWKSVLHLGVPFSFAQKQIITFESGYESTGFYYVQRGRIRLSYITANGQEKVLLYIGKGTLFHDIPTVAPTVNCVFTCMEPTEATFFSRKLINTKFAQQYPELMFNWVESTAIKSSNFFNQLCNSGLSDTFVNVCRLLYSMQVHHTEEGKIIPHLTQQELAAMLGIHRGSLHKALARLKTEGIIGEYSRRELVIHNSDQLRRYASE